jgi:hypothetical protein
MVGVADVRRPPFSCSAITVNHRDPAVEDSPIYHNFADGAAADSCDSCIGITLEHGVARRIDELQAVTEDGLRPRLDDHLHRGD